MRLMKTTGKAMMCVGLMALVAGCSASRFDSSSRAVSQPQNLTPVQSSQVQSSSLPPLNGQQDPNTSDPNSQFPQDPNSQLYGSQDPMLANSGDPALAGQTASADGSFVSLDDVTGGQTPGGRDLTGGLTPAKLLGAWTVSGNLQSCRLNLTQTTKSGTNRYRASAPNCAIPTLSLVSSWQLAGNQVQLFDESGSIVGALQLTGNRFIGTLSGGIAVTMEG